MAWENYGFAYVIDQRAGLDAQGGIVGWDHESWYGDSGRPPWLRHARQRRHRPLAGFEPARVTAENASASAGRPSHNGSNAAPSYVTGAPARPCGGTGTVAQRARPDAHDPVAVLHRPTAFAKPTAEHVRARIVHRRDRREVKADPVAYRLRHLRDPRLIDVVKAAAKAANWGRRVRRLEPTGARSARPAAAVSRACCMKATTAIARWLPKSTSTRPAARSSSSGWSSRTGLRADLEP